MELRARWWNGRWGRLARRDIWLKHDQVWRVEARKGDGDAKIWSHDYPTEHEARAAIAAMMKRTGGPGEWQDLTKITTDWSRQVRGKNTPPPQPTEDA